jgi:spore germination cell wall hydrolase CwlJ-like protein
MEVYVKRNVYGLLLAVLIMCTSGFFSISAKAADTSTVANTIATKTAVKSANTSSAKVVSKKIKVNNTFYCHKALKIKKSKIKKSYNVCSNNTKIATVSKDGTVKGLKKGSTVITLTSKKTGDVYATINVTVKNRYTQSQLRLMSAIIYAEAGSECYAGKKAVGIVIMNRVRSSAYPNTLSEVLYQPGQFGPARNGSLNKALSLYDQGKMDKKCIKAAKAALNGSTMVTYQNVSTDMSSYFFFSGYVSGKRLQIQGHQFK